jgi:hypothetical protein
MPQDYWVDNHEGFTVSNPGFGIAIDQNGYVYLGSGGYSPSMIWEANRGSTNIAKYDIRGNLMTNFGNFVGIKSMAFDYSGNLIVLDANGCQIFDSNLNKKTNFSADGNWGNNVAVDYSNLIRIGDPSAISIYDLRGNLITNYSGIDIANYKGPLSALCSYYNSERVSFIAISDDAKSYIISCNRWNLGTGFGMLYDSQIGQINIMLNQSSLYNSGSGVPAFFPRSSDLAIYSGDKVKILRSTYYGKDLALNPTSPPLPVILQQSQRAGTTYLDIDYKVIAATNTPVKVGMLAYVNGQTNLNSVIIPKTFVDGTGSNLGANIPPNTTKRVTWDMGRDWSTNVGTVQIEILANDGRPLQPQMWTNNPKNLPEKLTGTVTDAWSMWLWLLATQDSRFPRVNLVNGTVQGASSNYYGQTLYGITQTNYNYVGMTNRVYTNYMGTGQSWTNSEMLYSNSYIYGITTNGDKFLQEIVDSQAPLITP